MDKLLSIAMFLGVGLAFVFVGLTASSLVHPKLRQRDKDSTYECGEETIGSNWVQFDLRFYIVALFFLVFDVEVALIYPWAAIFREFPREALILGAPFIGLVVIGYAYEWHAGSLDWVRGTVHTALKNDTSVGDLATLARRDPQALEDQAVRSPSEKQNSGISSIETAATSPTATQRVSV